MRRAGLSLLAIVGLVCGMLVVSAPASLAQGATAGQFKPLPTARIMDTRNGTGTTAAAFSAGETRVLQ